MSNPIIQLKQNLNRKIIIEFNGFQRVLQTLVFLRNDLELLLRDGQNNERYGVEIPNPALSRIVTLVCFIYLHSKKDFI